MKQKLMLIVFALLCSTLQLKAQSSISYHGECDVSYSSGIGEISIDRYNLHTIHGIMVDDKCSVGVGAGIDNYTFDHNISVVVPIYLSVKGYLPMTNILYGFIGLDCGVGIGATEYAKGLRGLYLTPSLGLKIGHLKLQIGYNVQRISEEMTGVNLGAVQAKLGVMF
ncbi:MAG: hypothetical protein IKB37_01955 [Rikenellaceae bacterium]|nr:hypothetical protein [Rikenellaceae bacterium]